MQLKRFQAKSIHGFLDFDFRFNKDVTFLTGINGSGKTSVVQSLISLITPSLLLLSNLQFKSISISIVHDDQDLTIASERNDNIVTLSTSMTNEPFIIPPF